MKKRISLFFSALVFLQLLIPFNATASYYGQPQSYLDFEKYLNTTYGTVSTSIGTIELEHSVAENILGATVYLPHDMWIQTDWDSKVFSPYAIKYGVNLNIGEKNKIMHQLIEIQEHIYSDAIARFPDLKIKGGYYTSFYEYPTLKVGLVSIDFLSWNNYVVDNDISMARIDKFKWNSSLDDYDFSEYVQSWEESKTRSQQEDDIVEEITFVEDSTQPPEQSKTQTQKNSTKAYVTTKNANLHIKSNSSSDILLIVPKGKKVKHIGQTASFYKVDYMGNIGYILKSTAKLSK